MSLLRRWHPCVDGTPLYRSVRAKLVRCGPVARGMKFIAVAISDGSISPLSDAQTAGKVGDATVRMTLIESSVEQGIPQARAPCMGADANEAACILPSLHQSPRGIGSLVRPVLSLLVVTMVITQQAR